MRGDEGTGLWGAALVFGGKYSNMVGMSPRPSVLSKPIAVARDFSPRWESLRALFKAVDGRITVMM